jgi:hypothetical protein
VSVGPAINRDEDDDPMIKSMTGFASLTREHEAATISATIVRESPVPDAIADATIAPLETRLRACAAGGTRPGRGRGRRPARGGDARRDLNEFLTALGAPSSGRVNKVSCRGR